MNPIHHKQAIKWIHRRLDGLLDERQSSLLEEHLNSCDTCRAYAEDMNMLPVYLQRKFHARWNHQQGSVQDVTKSVTASARRIPVRRRVSSGVRWLAGATALVLLSFLINLLIPQLQNTSTPASETKAAGNLPQAQHRLLAFASDQNGNSDIYTIHPDGSALTNLSNHPAEDSNPIWSRDGRQIAFESNRENFMRIYLMDADGSNLTPFTDDKADHGYSYQLPLNVDGKSSPWSPDGSKLLFLRSSMGGDAPIESLYVKEINAGNKVLLASGKFSLYDISWSPNGKYIAYVLNDSPTADQAFVPSIYVIDPNGNNRRELKALIPQDEYLALPYYWSSDGQSIIFTAIKDNPLRQTVYEFDLETNTFLNKTETKPRVADWSKDVSLIMDVNQEGTPYVWERSDGTRNTFEASKAWGERCSLDFARSYNSNFAFGIHCPQELKLYWANQDGSTIRQVLDLRTADGIPGDIIWSPDDQYVAFTLASDETSLYILNVQAALREAPVQPEQVVIGQGEVYTIPSWQPVVVYEEVVEERPTPKPEQTSSNQSLIAFAAVIENANLEIYTMRPGRSLTNLTNHPARDANPAWSPDGKRIAFESDRNGATQIYLMNADGSDVTPLTNSDTTQTLGKDVSSVWSPDGSRLKFFGLTDQWNIYLVNVDGSGLTPLSDVELSPIIDSKAQWSPNGRYVAFLSNNPGNPEKPQLHVFDTEEKQSTDITNLLQDNEVLVNFDFHWSADGMSPGFVAYRQTDGGEDQWIAYEADLAANILMEKATSSTPLADWRAGTSFFVDGSLFTWLRSDNTESILNLSESCQAGDKTQDPFAYSYDRSPRGNLLIYVFCSNDEVWLYHANADGTSIKQLLDFPFSFRKGDFADVSWSIDEQFVAFQVASSNKTELYILNIFEAFRDPSIRPFQLTLGGGEPSYYGLPSWQPVP